MRKARSSRKAWDEALATYRRGSHRLLLATLALAALSGALHVVAAGLLGLIGYELGDLWAALGGSADLARLVAFGAVDLALVGAIAARVRKPRWRWRWTVPPPIQPVTTALTTVILLGFLLQPTLVPLRLDGSAWLARAANLVDGTATVTVVDSVVWLVRWLVPPRIVPGAPIDPADFDRDLDADRVPLIDRWDEALLDAAGGDRELYARTKAVMWVESGGRQFALSSTGCAGLMQFCATTAQEPRLHDIFGVGRVTACGCDDCSVPREVQVALETDAHALDEPPDFPCALSDARFDAERSIRAGVEWVRLLGGQVGGNLPLIYVGYNAGPSIARSLYRSLGQRGDVTIDDLRPKLAAALQGRYGSSARGRAQGLLDVHLPKLMAAYARWSGTPTK